MGQQVGEGRILMPHHLPHHTHLLQVGQQVGGVHETARVRLRPPYSHTVVYAC